MSVSCPPRCHEAEQGRLGQSGHDVPSEASCAVALVGVVPEVLPQTGRPSHELGVSGSPMAEIALFVAESLFPT